MVFAALAGARNFREIADRAADLPAELLVLVECRVHRVSGMPVAPSAATIRRIAHDIDADAADERVCAWLRAHAMAVVVTGDDRGEVPGRLVAVAIDGKTIRNTCRPGDEGSEIRLFPALTHSEAIVIAQVRIPADTNEITQVPALLDGVDLTGVVVTGDAAHAQHTTAASPDGRTGWSLRAGGEGESVRHEALRHIPAEGGTDSKGGLLGPMTYLDPKGEGDQSMSANRWPGSRCLGRRAGGPARYGESLIA